MYIRIFDEEKDISDCTKIFVDSFYPLMWPLIESYSEDLIKDIIALTYCMSSYGIVAEVNGKARGMIFGYSHASWHLIPESLNQIYKMTYKLISGEYELSRIAWRHTRQILLHLPQFLLRKRVYESEILMLGVAESYRRQGIGKALIDRFIEIARKNDVHQINALAINILTELSELSYYERYGFVKYDQFTAKHFDIAARDKDPKFCKYRINILAEAN